MTENSLVIFTKAAQMLAEANTIQETKELKDLALTAADWAKRKGMGGEAIQYARSYALEAERKMGELLKKTERAKGAKGNPGGQGALIVQSPDVTTQPTLAEIGVSKRESAQAQELAEIPLETFEAIKVGKKTRTQAHRDKKEQKREERRKENTALAAKTPDPLTIKAKFATITIDPPWDWGDEGDVNQLGRAKPDYATKPILELLKLPVSELSDCDCHIYLWSTNRSLPKAFDLLEAWGFRYITLLTWPKPSFGMGNYFRGQTEHVLFGIRGSQPIKRKNASTLLPRWNRGNGHSSKPVEFGDFVESCSPGPYLEMFARGKRQGWTCWGAEV
jgi:N6-adenosine-specific RNA methylase IME4